ncbi:hypothetical protein PIB30_023259 [Stylosanthes scabra]|uniref:S phase cyclin A-associated protein in the endoplasmic reticulum N-terminal domain-containing protein n=1 Tax=Stylosanthes scabra TaxID=79078 RepID=A0ABU6YB86_9FABA|nr:hypothetical protein [Stylosanthes scabra]
MEDSDVADDQNSGWFQVKKKHRNSSKFSLQSWVGGFSGKNASNSMRTQHSMNGNDDKLHSKHNANLSTLGQNFSQDLVPGNVIGSPSVSAEEGGKSCLNTCEIRHNSESEKSAPALMTDSQGKLEETRKVAEVVKPDKGQKIRWGDLEEEHLAQPHDKLIGVGIKFGSIGDDSLLSCRKPENIPDVVHRDSYSAPEKDLAVLPKNVDAEIVSHQTPLSRCKDEMLVENGKDDKNLSLEDLESREMDGKKVDLDEGISCRDEKDDEVNKIENDSGTKNDLFLDKDAVVIENQAQAVTNELSDIEVSKLPAQNCSSSKTVTAQGIVSEVHEREPEAVGDCGASTEVRASRYGNAENLASHSQNLSASEDVDLNESKERFRQRLWCFLFENLNRSVDELYLLCELECDLEQMKEAILVLEEAASDFKELITRVEEFEKVKKSSQTLDGVPVILKSDHRRPHALSWEVRRMTTSPHRADILSSSLEAFRKIQQERAGMQSGSNTENAISKCLTSASVDNVKRSQTNDRTDIMTKPKKTNGSSDANQGSLNVKRSSVEGGKPSADTVQSECKQPDKILTSEVVASKLPLENSASFTTTKSKRDGPGSGVDKLLSKKDRIPTEVVNEKNTRSTDNIKRQIPLSEKDKEKRNTVQSKSLNAWKEKRNWEDILSSPFRVSSRMSYSPSIGRKSAERVAKRAGDESSKVNEVRFITSLNEENKKLILRQKLHESEMRRAEKLQVIKSKQREDLAREEAVLERRRLIEAEKLQRLAEIQRKKEEAQIRREEERKASSAAREARAIEQLRRKEERAKAQQEEAELLAQKLAERLNESEQRRKVYLEQIRERANLRDQSSPLMRRSINKEGQVRSAPGNGSDDPQTNVASSTGSSLGIGNITLQHTMKRRIKRIRQKLMSLKYEFVEPPLGGESGGIGYRVAMGAARAKVGRWLQELKRLRQARKEGATNIGLIISEMIKYLEGKDPELQASRQAGLLDFIASALPASHMSKPEACQVTLHLLKLLRVVLSVPANRTYFLAQNLLPPIIPMLSASLEYYIKIAASISTSSNSSMPSSNKASVENFESISEILNNFLWIVTAIFGHVSSEERQLQMRDGLLELLISYQVIHRLRDLFALHDRPQMEGSAFPAPILLSIHLLVVLTLRPGTVSYIDWESSSVAMQQEIGSEMTKFADPTHSFLNNSWGDYGPLSTINGSTVMHLPDVPEDRPLDEIVKMNGSDEAISNGNDSKLEDNSSAKLKNDDMIKTDEPDEPKKNQSRDIINSSVPLKDEKLVAVIATAPKNEKVSNLAQPLAFLLSAVSETGLVSLPSLLTAVLLQANNRSSSEQGSFILPSNFEEVAAGVLKVLNNVALLDHVFLQRMLARPDLKMEIFHLMSFLLSHCAGKWKAPNDQVGSLMLESLSLLGHFALFHPGNQAVLRWGKSPTILHKVCDLPFVFFSDPELMPILAGTLVAACYGCEQNKFVVQQELSVDMLLSLLRSCRNSSPASQLNPTLDNSSIDDSNEYNQLGSESRKPLSDIPMKHSRSNVNGKGSRTSLIKGGASGNSIKPGRIRSLRDGKATKSSEEMATKNTHPVSETSTLMVSFTDPQAPKHHWYGGTRDNNNAWSWFKSTNFDYGDINDEHATSVAAAAFAIHSLEEEESRNSQKIREGPKSSRTQTMRRKEIISRRPSYGETSIKISFGQEPRTKETAFPVRRSSGISSPKSPPPALAAGYQKQKGIPLQQKNVSTSPQTWQKTKIENIQQR